MLLNSGKAVKKSGARGKKKIVEFHEVPIYRDTREREAYDKCKYLPHQNDREKARRRGF